MDEFLMSLIFILIILTVVMVIWAIVDIFQKNLSLTEKLLWLIVIILAPIIGTLVYFLLGRRIR
ncbi:PLDc N-terminal domain-containing protein [Gramella jeungdoensis]|uniref:PLDc N-terminal domain-containing protein n=1 Tax=Gramella jeungdoensis TaxID=708091 RepID=A0ABT0YXJ6_9FLAO|nr:PLDc N-terminal domain-containing protein [Gramella jeungdoensis]MCM8568059.1 PLDc N-terminal domain-containing protein [Gramella jeungdoensis]